MGRDGNDDPKETGLPKAHSSPVTFTHKSMVRVFSFLVGLGSTENSSLRPRRSDRRKRTPSSTHETGSERREDTGKSRRRDFILKCITTELNFPRRPPHSRRTSPPSDPAATEVGHFHTFRARSF